MECGIFLPVQAMSPQSSLGAVGRVVKAMLSGLAMLFVLICCVLRAEDAGRTPIPETVATVRPPAPEPVPAPLKWTPSDLISLGLIVLGATVVFIPVPKWRSAKGARKPQDAPVLEVCRPAANGSRPSLGSDRSSVHQVSTV